MTFKRELSAAVPAFELSFADTRMRLKMSNQGATARKRKIAFVALERSLAGMDAAMIFDIFLQNETRLANVAFVGFFTGMRPIVTRQVRFRR